MAFSPLTTPQLPTYLHYLEHYAKATPDAPAMWFEGATTSYAQLAAQVATLSSALTALGASTGSRIATLSTPRPEYLVAMLATMHAGAVWLGLNPKYTYSELRHVLEDAAPSIVLSLDSVDGQDVSTEMARLAAEIGAVGAFRIGPATPESHLQSLPDTTEADLTYTVPEVHPHQPAVIVYTSGSSGAPKGAVLSHSGLSYAARVEAGAIGIKAPRVPCNLPINHVACIADLTGTTLVSGGMLAFLERFDPAELLSLIPELHLTNLMTVPTVLQLIAQDPLFELADLSSLQCVAWGGAALPIDVIKTYRSRGIPLMTVYGMTETIASITFASDAESDETLAETVGRFDPGMEVRLADNAAVVPMGEHGEVQVRHEGLFLEYFRNPAATSGAYTEDGWFRTGDIGALRSDGTLQLIGRQSDMIKSGGYNVYPREIELRLESFPGVTTAAVVGRADGTFGEVAIAFVLPTPGLELTVEALREYSRAHLANYKVPKEFHVVSELPLLPVGKVDKQQLRRRYL